MGGALQYTHYPTTDQHARVPNPYSIIGPDTVPFGRHLNAFCSLVALVRPLWH